MSVALIACSNGYGHTRRLLSIQYALKQRKIKSIIFAKKNIILYLCKIYNLKNPHYFDFDNNTDVTSLINGKAFNWEKKLPSLDKFKIVLSDNLPDILKIRSDAILSGSFLWHKTLKKINSKIFKKHQSLLLNYKPIMIASNLFSPKYIDEFAKLEKVGLYTFNNTKVYKKKIKENNLLISFGSSGNNKYFNRVLNNLMKNKEFIKTFGRIYIDPKFFSKNFTKNCYQATYDSKMYNSIKTAIIRPGIGTITELIQRNIKILTVYEPNNIEMHNNSKILIKYKLAIRFKQNQNISKLLSKFDFIKKNNRKKLRFTGASETAKILENKL